MDVRIHQLWRSEQLFLRHHPWAGCFTRWAPELPRPRQSRRKKRVKESGEEQGFHSLTLPITLHHCRRSEGSRHSR
ncbi:hypothetical protein B0O80DRAFT_286362 [Mortierella sp. GBAus27b]|nr:hypothetical protein B0O80DRAFT_286362 [Mortierella sp. GBAus27b]